MTSAPQSHLFKYKNGASSLAAQPGTKPVHNRKKCVHPPKYEKKKTIAVMIRPIKEGILKAKLYHPKVPYVSSISNDFVRPTCDCTTLLHTIHFVTIYIIHSLPNKHPWCGHPNPYVDLPGIWWTVWINGLLNKAYYLLINRIYWGYNPVLHSWNILLGGSF